MLWFLFGRAHHNPPPRVCPVLRQETIPVYAPLKVSLQTDKGPIQVTLEHGQYLVKNGPATSTILAVNMTTKIVGTTTDKDAVEYNKRVRECQTRNGEF